MPAPSRQVPHYACMLSCIDFGTFGNSFSIKYNFLVFHQTEPPAFYCSIMLLICRVLQCSDRKSATSCDCRCNQYKLSRTTLRTCA